MNILLRFADILVFGHIARLTQGTPAHNALHCRVGLASGRSLGRDRTGDVVLVVLARAGQTNSATTLDLFLPTSEDRPSYMGSRWSDATARAD